MKKIKKFVKNCPLAVSILCSWAIIAAFEHLPIQAQETPAQDAVRQEDNSWVSGETQEIIAGDALGGVISSNRAPDLSEQAIMKGDEADDVALDTPANQSGTSLGDGTQSDSGVQPGSDAQSGSAAQSENNASSEADTQSDNGSDGKEDAKPKKIKPEYLTYEKKKTDSPWYTDPGKIPLTTAYDYQKVKKDYFDDAVFIGDSRIVGMNDYSGLTNAKFFAKTGLTVYNLLDEEFVKDPNSGKNVSVSYMMQHYTYGKIYLMVGINELGTGGTKRFQEAYKEVLKKFRQWQPDAVIYVQSIMGVSPKKDKSDPVFNNTNIRDKNYAISKLTDGIHIFYLNIQELYEDKDHNLTQDLTFDDVHLYAQHYDRWVKYLKTHAVVKGEEK